LQVARTRHSAGEGNRHARWLFGICLITADGHVYEVGDSRAEFTIQSISKPFTYALILDELGSPIVRDRIGVEPTGEVFNSIAIEESTGRPLNPMVNVGAIAAAGMVVEQHGEAALEQLLASYGRFAGRTLVVDEETFESESATAHRNRALAHLLLGSGALRSAPDVALELYLRQCSVRVDAHDLALMAATLANGGINPISGERAATSATVAHVLTVMATCGMYDGAGEWLYTVGLPAKSGVAGGILAVLPGHLGIAVFSPLLDSHGNSVRGVAVCRQVSRELGLHLLRPSRDASSRLRNAEGHDGSELLAIELQGELDFMALEPAVRRIWQSAELPRFVILDLYRITSVDDAAAPLLTALANALRERGGALAISRAAHLTLPMEPQADLPTFDSLEQAVTWATRS
jgi:glutaminase